MFSGSASQYSEISAQYWFASAVSGSIAAHALADNAALVGVNLDEEAAKLLQYQQAYQASAKMIEVGSRLFDVLLSGAGG